MEALMDGAIDFIRVRQLNFAVAALITIVYVVYQYWAVLFPNKSEQDEELDQVCSKHRLSRSRSRSGSKIRRKSSVHRHDGRHGRGRRYGRCSNCSMCNNDAL